MRWILVTLLAANILMFLYVQFSGSNMSENEVVVSSEGAASREPDVSGVFGSLTLLSELEEKSDADAGIDSIRVAQKDDNDKPSLSDVAQSVKPNPLSKTKSTEIAQPLCTLVGKFPKLLPAEYFAEKLEAFGVRAEVKHLVVSSQAGYWLHLPPQPSRKQALRLLAELHRQNVDSYVIPTGNLKNGISLGMFSQQERAENVKESVLKLGYQPEILAEPREQREVWVFLPQGESTKISDERWSELLSGKELLEKRQNLCSDVASA